MSVSKFSFDFFNTTSFSGDVDDGDDDSAPISIIHTQSNSRRRRRRRRRKTPKRYRISLTQTLSFFVDESLVFFIYMYKKIQRERLRRFLLELFLKEFC
uniref:Uncharacterized protein n=1 Tax=Populus trichocarpa TaxID=3694 RepID=A0A2K2B046_POPTR